MIFHDSEIDGAFVIELEPHEDDRGFFARTFCQREFEEHGLESSVAQCSVSFNRHKGTLRGMHYQAPPHEEVRLVRCISGAIYDVIIDLRPNSRSMMGWMALTLDTKTHRMLYVPAGLAHGFLTLEDNTEVFYQMSEFYYPELARGVRWDDPAFDIVWPLPVSVISEKDRSWPSYVLEKEIAG